MFFVGTGIFFVAALIQGRISRTLLLSVTLPIIMLAAFTSYRAYTGYVGVNLFRPESLDYFRAWGVDLVMMLIPSQGVSWLCDWLHLSVSRSDQEFFGDASVWMTTFSAPFLLIGTIGFLRMSRHTFALPLLLIAVSGCYFALGPSLKINSLRPPTEVTMSPAAPLSQRLMPEKLA